MQAWPGHRIDHRDRAYFRFQFESDMDRLRGKGEFRIQSVDDERRLAVVDGRNTPSALTTFVVSADWERGCGKSEWQQLQRYYENGFRTVVVGQFAHSSPGPAPVILAGLHLDGRLEYLRCLACGCDHHSSTDLCQSLATSCFNIKNVPRIQIT